MKPFSFKYNSYVTTFFCKIALCSIACYIRVLRSFHRKTVQQRKYGKGIIYFLPPRPLHVERIRDTVQSYENGDWSGIELGSSAGRRFHLTERSLKGS